MTEQRIFPFFVNGVFWKRMGVDENIIKQGRLAYSVMTKLPCMLINGETMPDMMAKMKQVFFQLAECGQQEHGKVAYWVSGFWLCDDELYIEDGNLYKKDLVAEISP